MQTRQNVDAAIFALGDVFAMCLALWVTIALRGLEIPTWGYVAGVLYPFSAVFILSLIVFYISGLYESHTVILKGRIPALILNATIINTVLGLAFFYFLPTVDISPKITLLLYVVISFSFLVAWRIYGGRVFGIKHKEPAILLGGGEEMKMLITAVNAAPYYGMEFIHTINLDEASGVGVQKDVLPILKRTHVETIVADYAHPRLANLLPRLQELQFQGITFFDQSQVYEDIFDRIPLSLIGYGWLLEHVSFRTHVGYDLLKRLMDITLALILLVPSILFYPLAYLLIKLDDGGPIFIKQDRVGENNSLFTIMKFRTMHTADSGKWVTPNDPRITRVGYFLRATRIDELPQLWNVLLGDLSLIGPRPELPDLV